MQDNIYLNFGNSLIKKLPSSISTIFFSSGELVLIVPFTLLYNTLYFLKSHTLSQYKVLADMTAVDYPEKAKRFELVINLLSIRFNSRIRIKTFINEMTPIKSITGLYKSSNWLE